MPILGNVHVHNAHVHINIKFYFKMWERYENLPIKWVWQIEIEVWYTSTGIAIDTWTLLNSRNFRRGIEVLSSYRIAHHYRHYKISK